MHGVSFRPTIPLLISAAASRLAHMKMESLLFGKEYIFTPYKVKVHCDFYKYEHQSPKMLWWRWSLFVIFDF